MKEIKRQNFSGERALFATDGAVITECIFADGESPLKESRNIELYCDLVHERADGEGHCD